MNNLPPLPTGLIDVRHVQGFPGYAVGYDSVEASVWSCWARIPLGKGYGSRTEIGTTWKRLKPIPDGLGYHCVSPFIAGRQYKRKVHQLVAEAFLGPRPPGLEVCHGPLGSGCNLPSNLSYGTRAKNSADRLRDGTHGRGERSGTAKLDESKVREIFALRAAGLVHLAIARQMGLHPHYVGLILAGKRWGHLGLANSNERN